jgi:hypothetical protein
LLSPVLNSRFIRGARAGVVGAAAATGALLAFGLRQGMPARPFNAVAALLLGTGARSVWGFDLRVSTTGVLLLLAGCVTASLILSVAVDAMTARSARPRVAITMFGIALLVGLIGVALVARHAPDFVGPQPIGAMTISQAVVVTVLISAGFASGMRLAR